MTAPDGLDNSRRRRRCAQDTPRAPRTRRTHQMRLFAPDAAGLTNSRGWLPAELRDWKHVVITRRNYSLSSQLISSRAITRNVKPSLSNFRAFSELQEPIPTFRKQHGDFGKYIVSGRNPAQGRGKVMLCRAHMRMQAEQVPLMDKTNTTGS